MAYRPSIHSVGGAPNSSTAPTVSGKRQPATDGEAIVSAGATKKQGFHIKALSHRELKISSASFFNRASSLDVSRYVERIFGFPEVQGVKVSWRGHFALISTRQESFHPCHISASLRQLSTLLRHDSESSPADEKTRDVFIIKASLGATVWARRPGHSVRWTMAHSLPGRVRFHSPALESNQHLAQVLEGELGATAGVEDFSVSPLTGTVLLKYDPRMLSVSRLGQHLRAVTDRNRISYHPHRIDPDFPLNTTCLPLALGTELIFPPAAPAIGLLVLLANRPTLAAAWRRTFKDKKLGCDFLDSIVLFGCLATGHIFGMALIGWCLALGRLLLKKTREDSQKILKSAFSKQPRFAWQVVGGNEIEVTIDSLKVGDIVAVHAGDMLPVDGQVVDGMGLVDQHTLTGEAAPVEKSPGDAVFATTMLISGDITILVTCAGSETTSAKIGAILEQTAAFKFSAQSRGEALSDKAVPPTLALGGAGLALLGLDGGVAVLNSECGTGIRMAAPLGVLSSLTLCATKGILVKDGLALEEIHRVDTVLFDKTGTLTREVPEVCGVFAQGRWKSAEILRLAAIAEQRFSHPIAEAILQEARTMGLTLTTPESSDYKIGFGVEVCVAGRVVKVGSPRYLESEGMSLPEAIRRRLTMAGGMGHSLVLVGVDDEVAGAIELRAACRPEAFHMIQKLRALGISEIAVVSGDRQEPTQHLAESLGLDRFFAEVLPHEKSALVEKLQAEGRKICFVGDGVNDSIALKKANVSISLRGASAIATDSAQVILLEENLDRITDFVKISHMANANINRSWRMIVLPNLLCVAGVFTMGFGVFHSVLTNNVAALGALFNGMLPLQKAARIRAQKDLDADTLLLRSRISQKLHS